MKMKYLVLIVFTFGFFGCRENNLVEVELPEPEKKTITRFANPEDVVAKEGVFDFPKLPYSYDEFENFVDGRTMELHYSKHFLNYTDKLNNLVDQNRAIQDIGIEEILGLPKIDNLDVLNNAGGYYNHKLFFEVLTNKKTKLSTSLNEAILKDFGSFDNFKSEFIALSNKQLGSSWVWLVVNTKERKLQLTATQNQDNPLMKEAETKGTPILCLDLWEHAYYLKYNMSRKEYVVNFFEVINWDAVSKKYDKLTTPVAPKPVLNSTN